MLDEIGKDHAGVLTGSFGLTGALVGSFSGNFTGSTIISLAGPPSPIIAPVYSPTTPSICTGL